MHTRYVVVVFYVHNFQTYHKTQTNIPNKYSIPILTNTIICSILIFKKTKKDLSNHTSGVGAPLIDRSL